MDSELIELVMSGAQLYEAEGIVETPIDAVAATDRGTLVFLAGWWRADWSLGAEVLTLPPIADRQGDSWSFGVTPDRLIQPPEDPAVQARVARARLETDLERVAYLRALARAAEAMPEADLNPHIEAVLARPEFDLQAHIQRETAERAVGKILLYDTRGAVVDALAIDELGGAESLLEDGPLEPYAVKWVQQPEGHRPSLESYVEWLSKQSPAAPNTLQEPGVISASGPLQEIVTSLVAR